MVIPTRNRAPKLERTLQSLASQTVSAQEFEVIVVDNGSADRTPEVLRCWRERLPHWQCFKQLQPGAAAARNRGVLASRGQVVLFLDDDVVAAPDLIQEHLETHISHPGSAVLGYVRNGWNKNDSAFYWVISHKELLHSFHFPNPSDVPFLHLYTCNASIPRSALLKAGLFDEQFVGAAFEDTDLGYRLKRSGCRLIFNSRAAVLHEPLLSLATFEQKRFNAGNALRQLIKKHPELREVLLPPTWRWMVRCGLGWTATPLTRVFERRVPLAPLLLPMLGEACWFHLERHFWTGYRKASYSKTRAAQS